MANVHKASRVIPNSGGRWDMDTGATHILNGSHTLCGVRVGPESKGWFSTWFGASCQRCLRKERTQREARLYRR